MDQFCSTDCKCILSWLSQHARMKLRLKSSKYFTVCIAIIILALLAAGRYLWSSAAVDDNWSSSFLEDSILNQPLSSKAITNIEY